MKKNVLIAIVGFIFQLNCTDVNCQTPPYLYRVYPLHETPKQMMLSWSGPTGQVYYIKKKVGNGSWSNWVLTVGQIDNGPFNDNDIYTYKVAYIYDIDYIESNELSNSFQKVWPVKINGCTDESREILHNYNQLIVQPGDDYSGASYHLHEGLDIQGPQNTINECIVAALGGKIIRVENRELTNPLSPGWRVTIEIEKDGNTQRYSFSHMDPHVVDNFTPDEIADNITVSPGEYIGYIYKPSIWQNFSTHIHVQYWNGQFLDNDADVYYNSENPLTLWDNNTYRDPMGQAPMLAGVIYIKGMTDNNNPEQFSQAGIVYQEVDIVARAYDPQSSDPPFQAPKTIGYYIQHFTDESQLTDAVKPAGQYYMLFDFGNPYDEYYSPNSQPDYTMMDIMFFDVENNIELVDGDPSEDSDYEWATSYSYLVTNTVGTDGSRTDLDASQFWATDIKQPTTGILYAGGANGSDYNSTKAVWYGEAAFPDGKYKVNIVMTDFVNSAIVSPVVFVDNFRPIITEAIVTQGSQTIYRGKWNHSGSQFVYANPDNNVAGASQDLQIFLTASEPMAVVKFTISDLPGASWMYCSAVTGSNNTQWQYILPNSLFQGLAANTEITFGLVIDGFDYSFNDIYGFSSAETTNNGNALKRNTSGNWPSGTVNNDTRHWFRIMKYIAPHADFSYPAIASVNTGVHFTDLSQPEPTAWNWSFPGGTPSSSTLKNPIVQYTATGTYNVMLNATIAGQVYSKSASIQIVDLIAEFTFQQNATQNLTIDFINQSEPATEISSYKWKFGDLTESTLPNPTHTYSSAGTYTVTLEATKLTLTVSTQQTINVDYLEPPQADFTYSVTPYGQYQIIVDFFDNSTGVVGNWYWNFTGGTPSSSGLQNPQDIVMSSQTTNYVTLTVSNVIGMSEITQTISTATAGAYMLCSTAESSYDPYEYELTADIVDFNATEPVNILYTFNFGDGESEPRLDNYTSMTMTHVYPDAGDYIFTATAEWTEPVTGVAMESNCSKQVNVCPGNLAITTEYSPVDPIYPNIPVNFRGKVNSANPDEMYHWIWTFYSSSGSVVAFKTINSINGGWHDYFPVTFPATGTYTVNVFVYGNLGSVEDEFQINAVSVPKCISAALDGPSQTGIGYTEYSSQSEGCSDICYPSVLKWSVYNSSGQLVYGPVQKTGSISEWYNEDFKKMQLYFPYNGNFTIMLEVWSNDDDMAYNLPCTPENYYAISCYDIAYKTVTVNSNIPVILVYDADNNNENNIFCKEQSVKFNIANSSGGAFNWTVTIPTYISVPTDWLTIEGADAGSSGKEKSGSGNAQITLLVTRNNGGDRGVHIEVTATNAIKKYYYLTQYSCEGPNEQNVTSGESSNNDKFGYSVAIEGIYAVVGAPFKEYAGNPWAGAAYVLKRVDGDWQKIAKLTPSDLNKYDLFGISVDISGEYIVVGAEGDHDGILHPRIGNAYLFKKPTGGEWHDMTEKTKLPRPSTNAGAKFGHDVAISGDWAVVGCPYGDYNGNKSGGVFLYHRNTGGEDYWGGPYTQMYGDNNKHYFGTSVDIDGDILVAGAPVDGNDAGYVKIYERNLNVMGKLLIKTSFRNNKTNTKFCPRKKRFFE